MLEDNIGGLVLKRKRGEQIVIGDEIIVIEVADVRGDIVSLRILAPKDIKVHRREVYEQIKVRESNSEKQGA